MRGDQALIDFLDKRITEEWGAVQAFINAKITDAITGEAMSYRIEAEAKAPLMDIGDRYVPSQFEATAYRRIERDLKAKKTLLDIAQVSALTINRDNEGEYTGLMLALRYLGACYSDHPEYRERFRP
jgi:hypothetical protein